MKKKNFRKAVKRVFYADLIFLAISLAILVYVKFTNQPLGWGVSIGVLSLLGLWVIGDIIYMRRYWQFKYISRSKAVAKERTVIAVVYLIIYTVGMVMDYNGGHYFESILGLFATVMLVAGLFIVQLRHYKKALLYDIDEFDSIAQFEEVHPKAIKQS